MERRVKRVYSLSLRRQQADATRQRIIEAARRLFSSGGYDRVTLPQIASAAAVAPQTLYVAFRTKGAIANAVIEAVWAEVGGAELRHLAEAAPNAAALAGLIANLSRRLHAAAGGLVQLMRAASDPTVAAQYERLEGVRYRTQRALLMNRLPGNRMSRLSRSEAIDAIWALTAGDLFYLLVSRRGWSEERYELWLTEELARILGVAPAKIRHQRGRGG